MIAERGTPGRPARLVAILVLATASPVLAAERCPTHFAQARVPVLTNPRLAARTVPLCYAAFAVLHSGVSRTPVYAAERLTRASVAAARTVDRIDSFHDEPRLPEAARADLDDYVRSGFDRGHMAPAGDMPTAEAQGQSFSLANVVPQDRALNRGLWAAIEESVRRLATTRGTLFVVTGTVFAGASVESIGGGVLVPTQLFKAVYDPARAEAAAYLVDNRADAGWRAVPLAELARLSGLEPFPGVTASPMDLPEPRTFSRGDEAGDGRPKGRGREEASFEDWAKAELHRLARRLWRELMRSIF